MWVLIQARQLAAIAFLALIFLVPAALTTAQELVIKGSGAASELSQLMGQSSSLQGQFKQAQYDLAGEPMAHSSGSFKMLRPGYFSWEIELPDSQLILATPEFIWHHDRDLETVTRRPVNSSTAVSPLQILGGNEHILHSAFNVLKNSENVFTLTPNRDGKENSAGFSRLSLTFESGVLSAMEITDALNHRVMIHFAGVTNKPELSADDFGFIPPDGVDLFYYDQ